jgi:hypothetical protein
MTYGEMNSNYHPARLSQQVSTLGAEIINEIIDLSWKYGDQEISDYFAERGITVHLAPIREIRNAVRQGN